VTDDKEFLLLSKVLDQFLFPQLEQLQSAESLKKCVRKSALIYPFQQYCPVREEIEKCLQFILHCLRGSCSLMPLLDGEVVQLVDASVNLPDRVFVIGRQGAKRCS